MISQKFSYYLPQNAPYAFGSKEHILHISTAFKSDVLYICCDGSVKTYEEYEFFVAGVDGIIQEYIEEQKSPQKFSKWKFMFLNAFPLNTYALGHLLRLKAHNNYAFGIATNDHRLLALLESVQFHLLFELSVEHDPRIYKA